MVATEFDRFCEWFDVLAVTHRLHCSEDLRGKMKAEYFEVLAPYPVEIIEAAYQTLRRRMKKWPVPADWLEAMPPFGSVARLPLMTSAEQREHDHAEVLGYEAEGPCKCASCEAEGIVMPSRYVPRQDRDGNFYERRHPLKQGHAVLLGKWIHGKELRSWWSARAQFYENLEHLRPRVAALLNRKVPPPSELHG